MTKYFLSVEEIAVLTGFSKQFYYGEIYKCKVFGSGIPFKKFGPRAVKFDADEVIQWLETRSQDFRPLSEAVKLSKAGKITAGKQIETETK